MPSIGASRRRFREMQEFVLLLSSRKPPTTTSSAPMNPAIAPYRRAGRSARAPSAVRVVQRPGGCISTGARPTQRSWSRPPEIATTTSATPRRRRAPRKVRRDDDAAEVAARPREGRVVAQGHRASATTRRSSGSARSSAGGRRAGWRSPLRVARRCASTRPRRANGGAHDSDRESDGRGAAATRPPRLAGARAARWSAAAGWNGTAEQVHQPPDEFGVARRSVVDGPARRRLAHLAGPRRGDSRTRRRRTRMLSRPRACFNLRDRDAKRYRAGAVAERACRVARDVTGQINHEDARLCTSNAHLDAPRRAGDLHLASRHADEAQADGGACVFVVDRAFVARARAPPCRQACPITPCLPHRARETTRGRAERCAPISDRRRRASRLSPSGAAPQPARALARLARQSICAVPLLSEAPQAHNSLPIER